MPVRSAKKLPVPRVLVAAVLILWLAAACATAPAKALPEAAAPEGNLKTYEQFRSALDKNGETIDYDTLMQVYQTMMASPGPIAHMDRLLRLLISKRNPDPRIDQMILIFAARAIGHSRYSIPDAQGIFESILRKNERINEWVISFVAEAIGDYIDDLPQGDQLVDFMDRQLERVRSRPTGGREFFGYHFLPPPKSEFIRAYIGGIADQSDRQHERTRYYVLIKSGISEEEIQAAMKHLQNHGAPGEGTTCRLLLQCLLRYRQELLPRSPAQ